MAHDSCIIEHVGTSRRGTGRFWCQTHGANATGRYGKKLTECESAYLRKPEPESIGINPNEYDGGIAIWGAVPPIYNTTSLPPDKGIHVHARRNSESSKEKEIDNTFPAITINYQADLFRKSQILITQKTAVNFYIARHLNHPLKYLSCPYCKDIHLDAGYFAAHPHKKHLCHQCGRYFQDTERSVSNPIVLFREIWGTKELPDLITHSEKILNICQQDYPNGIQIWASNPAILWTASRPEEYGIHLHAYSAKNERVIDDTYASINIDGLNLDVTQVHQLMAQRTLDHISNKIVSLNCTNCGTKHFDGGKLGFKPHRKHTCNECGSHIENKGRHKLVVSNPLIDTLKELRSILSNQE